jgi:hypothetical protein
LLYSLCIFQTTAAALMVDGPTFDLTDFDETSGAITPATDIHRTVSSSDQKDSTGAFL